MTRRALVTRPHDDSGGVAEALRQRGYEPVIEPMLSIRYLDAPLPDRALYQGVLLTSANGARAVARLADWRDMPVWAVGEASAAEARRLGFVTVAAGGGDVAALAELAAREIDPKAGRLLHVAASRLAGDLAGSLASRGFAVDKAVLYEAEEAGVLSPDLTDLLAQGGLDLALFFSPRTAGTFVTLARRLLPPDALRGVDALALSGAVAEALKALPWQSIKAAARPTQTALLDLLDGV